MQLQSPERRSRDAGALLIAIAAAQVALHLATNVGDGIFRIDGWPAECAEPRWFCAQEVARRDGGGRDAEVLGAERRIPVAFDEGGSVRRGRAVDVEIARAAVGVE